MKNKKMIFSELGKFLPSSQIEVLQELDRQDDTSAAKIFKKLFRLETAFKTGNLVVWQKIMKEEREDFESFVVELQKHKIKDVL
ncbi:MAG: hypothetical protein U9M90_03270 [Patescibacteria group bacterium]|nr:hypothetical protein [Patescibacteria group bacterium]